MEPQWLTHLGRSLLSVVLGSGNGAVDNLEHVRAHEVALTEHAHASPVPIKKLPMLYELLKLQLGELHQPVDLILWPVEVFDAEGVDRHDLDTAPVAII